MFQPFGLHLSGWGSQYLRIGEFAFLHLALLTSLARNPPVVHGYSLSCWCVVHTRSSFPWPTRLHPTLSSTWCMLSRCSTALRLTSTPSAPLLTWDRLNHRGWAGHIEAYKAADGHKSAFHQTRCLQDALILPIKPYTETLLQDALILPIKPYTETLQHCPWFPNVTH